MDEADAFYTYHIMYLKLHLIVDNMQQDQLYHLDLNYTNICCTKKQLMLEMRIVDLYMRIIVDNDLTNLVLEISTYPGSTQKDSYEQ